jgi:small subunit ribosomal protein S4e
MSHQKRQTVSKKWPIARKGSTFVISGKSNQKYGIPALIVLRDILGIVANRKEARIAIMEKNLELNGRKLRSEKESISLLDVLKIVPSKKNYLLTLTNKGKFGIEEIAEKEANKKVSKVISKKKVNGGKIQLGLLDGRTFISDIKCGINDSVLFKFGEKKIEKSLELKEGAKLLVFEGKHAGQRGVVKAVDNENKIASIIGNDKSEVNALIKQIMVIE